MIRDWGNSHPLDYVPTSREAREEHNFRDAVFVELSKTVHSFGNHSVQIFVLFMSVGPIYFVLR